MSFDLISIGNQNACSSASYVSVLVLVAVWMLSPVTRLPVGSHRNGLCTSYGDCRNSLSVVGGLRPQALFSKLDH